MSTPRVTAEAARDLVHVEDFAVDRTPVTNERYASFVEETGHRIPAYWPEDTCPASMADHPVVGVDYFDAVAFARGAGGRLPTELEWMLCVGIDEATTFAWGDGFDKTHCNTIRSDHKGTTPVGVYPSGAAPSGCLDLCGNVWEMTCSADPDHDGTVIVKGGSWYDYPAHAKLDGKFRAPIHRIGRTVGFRLVYGGKERHPEFLDGQLLEACINYREASRDGTPDEPAEEFDFAALREELSAAHRNGLQALERIEETITIPDEGVDDMLSLFDIDDIDLRAAPEDDKGNDIAKAHVVAEEWYWRMHTFIAERPAILFVGAAAAVLLAATTLWASIAEPDARAYRENAARRALESTSASAESTHRAHRPTAIASANGSSMASSAAAIAARDAVVGLLGKDARRHTSSLRVLLAHGERSRAALELALETASTDTDKLRLRYALAALDEKRDGAGRPAASSGFPARGLALICDSFGAAEQNCLRELRRFGTACGVEVHLVLAGPNDFSRWLETKGADAGNVQIAHDRDSRFVATLGLRGGDGVVGLHTDGRTAFILPGLPGRARLEQQVAALH